MKIVKDFCKDKNVLLVGNSSILLEKENGKLIDSYDVVVRMNHGYPREELKKYVGEKTDIWICSYLNSRKQLQQKEFDIIKPKIVLRLNDDGPEEFIFKENSYVWPRPEHKIFWDELGSLPSTGCVSIYFFLEKIQIMKSLTIVGYNGFGSKENFFEETVNPGSKKHHNPENEKRYINGLLKENKILRINYEV